MREHRFEGTILFIVAMGAFALAGCASQPAGVRGEEEPTGVGGSTDAGSGSGGSVGTGGKTGAGGSVGTGGKAGSGGSVGTGGATGSGGSVGSGGATGSGGSAGVCTPGTTPITYTVTGTNNASWAGAGNGDTVVANASGYLPMTSSDCPKDADMQIALPWKDKIFNGCLDDCGDGNNAGHGLATVFDWTHTASGWVVAQLSSNLHWTGMWEPSTGPYPTMLVFWIKGAVGCEEDKFTVAIHAHGTNNNSTALKIPIAVSTSWQRVVIPWASFNVPASPYPDALTFTATGAGKVTFFIDQAYLSKTVPPP